VHYPNPDTARGAADAYDFVVIGADAWCQGCKTEPHEHVGPETAFCGRCGGFDSDHDYALPVHR
jgi:hypothetical protein